MSDLPKVSIFLSSSSDVKAERRIVSRAVAELAQRHQRYLTIELIDWEADFYSADRDFQGQIPNAADSDLVICIFHRRVGSELDPARYTRDENSYFKSAPLYYEGGSVYEFECAFERRMRDGTPDLYVFRKSAPVVYTEGPDLDEQRRQYQLLQAFLKRWSEDGQGHLIGGFNSFEDKEDFRTQFKIFLTRWIDDWTDEQGLTLLDWDPHPDANGSPFVGLAPFTENHRRVFFGRDNELHRAVELLEQAASRLDEFRHREQLSPGRLQDQQEAYASLIVLGASGSGKSSFLHAALLPQLVTPGLIDGVDRWLRADLRLNPQEPQPLLRLAEQLFEARFAGRGSDNTLKADQEHITDIANATGTEPLAAAFAATMFDTPAKMAAQLQQRPGHSGELIAHALQQVAANLVEREPGVSAERLRLLLSVDQLEALVSEGAGATAKACLTALESLAGSGVVWLVGAARNDHYSLLQAALPISRLLASGKRLDLLHPDRSQITELVEGPVRAAGLAYEVNENGDLRQHLIEDVSGSDALPLLQVTLSELFDRLSARQARAGSAGLADQNKLFLHADYQALSDDSELPGLFGAINRHAERSWQHFVQQSDGGNNTTQELQALLRRLALPSVEGVAIASRPIPVDSYANTEPRRKLVDALVGARLLVVDNREGVAWLRPGHDALLRHWVRAHEILEADQAHLRWRESMRQLAVHWDNAAPDDEAQHLSLPPASMAGALSLREAFGDELHQEPLQRNSGADVSSQSTLGDFLNGVYRQAGRNRNRTRIKLAAGFGVMAAVAIGMTLLWRQAESQRELAVTNLDLARQTADSLVLDLTEGFRHATGVPTNVLNQILDRAEDLHTKLESGNSDISTLQQGKIWRLFARGDTFVTQGRNAEALEKYLEARNLAQELSELDPSNSQWKRDLSVSYIKVGDVLVAQGNRAGALKAFEGSLEISKELSELDPDNAEWQRDLFVSYWRFASFSESAEQWSEASGYWEQVIFRLKEMQSRNILVPADEQYLLIAEKNLAAARGKAVESE
jgi:tetratricopeptide (TPR) repeat protein